MQKGLFGYWPKEPHPGGGGSQNGLLGPLPPTFNFSPIPMGGQPTQQPTSGGFPPHNTAIYIHLEVPTRILLQPLCPSPCLVNRPNTTPPPQVSPNFSHHKARVLESGCFQTRKMAWAGQQKPVQSSGGPNTGSMSMYFCPWGLPLNRWQWADENLTWGGGGPLEPPHIWGGGGCGWGSKGHKPISSMQISESFGSNLLLGRGGGGRRDVLERLTTVGGAPPPLPLGLTQ